MDFEPEHLCTVLAAGMMSTVSFPIRSEFYHPNYDEHRQRLIQPVQKKKERILIFICGKNNKFIPSTHSPNQ